MSTSACKIFAAAAVAGTPLLAAAWDEHGTEIGQCKFENEPAGVGYFWDPSCEMGKLGCDADGRNLECRFCGAGDFVSVPCPPSSCKFPNNPSVSWYWDTECVAGELGCWADGIHAQCRFCGDFLSASIPCPEGAAPPLAAACDFDEEPGTLHYWEPGCEMGMLGCNADGRNVGCRFCGEGDFADIKCPAEQVCTFGAPPTIPYYWEPRCKEDVSLGCMADGIHEECRYCAKRPFDGVPCPEDVAPLEGVCTWPLHDEPAIPYFWDTMCEEGILGCWADGIHKECRFCGDGVYSNITCPSTSTTMHV